MIWDIVNPCHHWKDRNFMRQFRIFLACSIALLSIPYTLATPSSAVGIDRPAPNAGNYEEGQVWSYRNRLGEENSTILINKIEQDPRLGFIYHISILEVKVKNPHQAGGVANELPHLPVSQNTLDTSLLMFLRNSESHPEYLEGYLLWKEAFDAGEAGIFTISIAEIVDVVEQSLTQPN